MIQIALTQGKVAKIDDEDYPLVMRHKWHYSEGYARTSFGGGTKMHRLILNAKAGQIVDHRDRDGLNNTRSNICICTRQQNSANRAPQSCSKSGFKGVTKLAFPQRWLAQIRVNGKTKFIGLFDDPKKAAAAYDRIAELKFGEFSLTNKKLGLI